MGIIISLIISLFVPNLSTTGCNAILSQIPQGTLGNCECDLSIGGVFSVDLNLEVICTIGIPEPAGQTCDLTITGSGDGFGFAFGGSVDLKVNTSCDFGPGTVNFNADGSVALAAGVDVTACEINVAFDNPATTAVNCNQCNLGCGSSGSEFTASVTCTQGATTLINGQCLDFTNLANTIILAL